MAFEISEARVKSGRITQTPFFLSLLFVFLIVCSSSSTTVNIPLSLLRYAHNRNLETLTLIILPTEELEISGLKQEAAEASQTIEKPQILSPFPLIPEMVVFPDEDKDVVDEEEDEEMEITRTTKDISVTSVLPLNSSTCVAASSTEFTDAGESAVEVLAPWLENGVVDDGNRQPQLQQQVARHPYIDPTPHVSSQFYTFNKESHALMVQCILEKRLATPDEIRNATPKPVLRSWRSVWKDRNEGTAYITAWKRIQDKLNAHVDPAHGHRLLYFKNNTFQYVSHTEQWQDIVTSFHGDADLRHLRLKDTIDQIKHVWTVGAKFYGIPESFIRVCLASCPVCSGVGQSNRVGGCSRSKRRRFEYTEAFDVPAKDVPNRLQQLAVKHKVVLCIRQKYIRYKPFMAEVKDYACHRAGEPTSVTSSKKSRVLKREPYTSKRCGCGFRIRAIVPIANYNEKDKSFVYQEEGSAVFKLYAVHTGHEPGPLDGNARIIHRVVGHKGAFEQDPMEYGSNDEIETDSYVSLMGKEVGDNLQPSVLQQVQELRSEVTFCEGKIMKMPREILGLLSQELPDILHRIRNIRESLQSKPHDSEDVMVMGNDELAHWEDRNHCANDVLYDKEVELIEDEDPDFGQTLRDEIPWDLMPSDLRSRKILPRENCKPVKWMLKGCDRFGEKSILDYCDEEEDSKFIKPLRHDETIAADHDLVGLQVDGFYSDTAKWYDSPNGLDPDVESGDGAYRHGVIG